MTEILRVEELTKSFRHGGALLAVLKGINLSIGAGEMVSIVGASGVGKSTFLHIVGTLDAATSGRIFYEGRDISKMRGGELSAFRNRTIGFVFQFHHLLDEFNALENTIMPGLIGNVGRRQLEERGRELLAQVGLAERLTHRPSELSGGEQQRVALARALIMQPRVLLADEPTGNLDSKNSDQLCELLFRLNEIHGTTLILVTHNNQLALKMPKQLEMKDGIIIEHRKGELTHDQKIN
jgi:lipoprotein-releasing system ATP-binding protein